MLTSLNETTVKKDPKFYNLDFKNKMLILKSLNKPHTEKLSLKTKKPTKANKYHHIPKAVRKS